MTDWQKDFVTGSVCIVFVAAGIMAVLSISLLIPSYRQLACIRAGGVPIYMDEIFDCKKL